MLPSTARAGIREGQCGVVGNGGSPISRQLLPHLQGPAVAACLSVAMGTVAQALLNIF